MASKIDERASAHAQDPLVPSVMAVRAIAFVMMQTGSRSMDLLVPSGSVARFSGMKPRSCRSERSECAEEAQTSS